MKLKHTARLMIFWFVCQLAAAVVPVDSISGDATPPIQAHDTCHEALSIDNDSASLHDHDEATQSVDCCEIGCQCCITGCQSMLGNHSNQAATGLMTSPMDRYSFVVPQTPTSTPFRPPISR